MAPTRERSTRRPALMPTKQPSRGNFRRFFLRGLAVVLPATLTLWVLAQA